MKIEVISATRYSEEKFWKQSALGISLKRLSSDKQIIPRITFNNQKGLSIVYNQGIIAAENHSCLVFIHDDVWIDDYYLSLRIADGLHHYQLIGVAGNRQRISQQPAWIFKNKNFIRDDNINLTGVVAHGKYPFGKISFYGEAPNECELLDGVILAARKSVLVDANCFFDPRFDFHCYDMDFCRTARQKKLRLGTWPICLTHQSSGRFGSEQWKKNYSTYLDKWGE